MNKFSFLFGVHLNKRLLIRTDSDMLAKNLQGVKVSAAEGAEYAQTVQKQLREERNDDEYDLFWNGVLTDQVLYNVTEPAITGRSRSES